MPRKPKPKNTLSAGQRVALSEQKRLGRESAVSDEPKAQDARAEGAEPDVSSRTDSAPAKKPTPKQKPQSATVKVDLSVGAGIHPPLHGMCNGPVSDGADISALFKGMGTPWVRFDKTDGARSGYILDISKIFPDMNADERDPESYRFRETDKYILAAVNCGARVIFRLGESFDIGTPEHKLTLPEDVDKLVVICVNIIKHYNNYFCGGFALGIEYFEIFSGIDLPEVLSHNKSESIFSLYAKIANGIKLYDENLKVGGMGFSSCSQLCREFIRYCARRRVPLDFLSISVFSSDPEEMGDELASFVHLLKNSQYASSELIVAQWGYLPRLEGVGDPMRIMNSVKATDAEQRRELFECKSGRARRVICRGGIA